MKQLLFSFTFAIFLCAQLSLQVQAQPKSYLDSLERVIQETEDLYNKANALNRLAVAYVFVDIDKAISYGLQSLATIPSDKKKAKAHICNTVGSLYAHKGSAKDAAIYLDSSIILFEQIGDTLGMASAYGNMGNFYYTIDKYGPALTYLQKSLKINEALNNSTGIAHNLLGLLTINVAQKDYEVGLINGKRALRLFNEKEVDNLGITCFNIGIIFYEMKEPDSALYYNKVAESFFEQSNGLENKAMVYQQYGQIYLSQNELSLARDYTSRAVEYQEHLGSEENKIRVQANLASIYYKLGEYQKSIQYYEVFQEMAMAISSIKYEKDALEGLSKCYLALGDYQKAYDFLERGFALRDSIMDEAKQRQLKELEVQYDSYKKDQENILLSKERDLAALKANRNVIFTYSAIVVLILVLLLSFLFLRQYRTRAEQQTLKLNHRLLRNQMNPHFIFNSLAAIQSFVYKSEPKEAGKYLSSFAKLVRAILENSREDYISLEKEIQWLENYLKLQLLRFDSKFEYHIEIDPNLDIDSVQIPPMLTQPFIENALEHGLKSIDYLGKLDILFQIKQDFLLISVSDNGVGLSAATKKIQPDDHVSLATTITKERLQFLNQYKRRKIIFDIRDISPKGVSVSFSIPLKHR